MGAVRRSCQTIAFPIGVPVSRSHKIVVSRWFVIPIAATSAAVSARVAQRAAPRFQLRGPDFGRIVLDPTRLRKVLRELALIEPQHVAIRAEDDRA
jgi:hypothetical protein